MPQSNRDLEVNIKKLQNNLFYYYFGPKFLFYDIFCQCNDKKYDYELDVIGMRTRSSHTFTMRRKKWSLGITLIIQRFSVIKLKYQENSFLFINYVKIEYFSYKM